MPVQKKEQWERFTREYRRMSAAGMSDVAIASAVGVTRQTISKWRELLSADGGHQPVAVPTVGEIGYRSHLEVSPPTKQSGIMGAPSMIDPASANNDETEWMKRLLGRLLFENERLKAIVAGEIGGHGRD